MNFKNTFADFKNTLSSYLRCECGHTNFNLTLHAITVEIECGNCGRTYRFGVNYFRNKR